MPKNKKNPMIVFYQKHRKAVISTLFVLSVVFLSVLGQSQWFKSSLLEIEHPFDGAIYPIDKSPDYMSWPGNEKTDLYSSIDNKYLTKLPDYDQALLIMDDKELAKNKVANNAKKNISCCLSWILS